MQTLDQQLPLQTHGNDVGMRQQLFLHKLEARDGSAIFARPVVAALREGCQPEGTQKQCPDQQVPLQSYGNDVERKGQARQF